MGYAEDLVATDAYESKDSGSHIAIVLYDSADPLKPLIGAATGHNVTDDFEVLPVEEAGADGVDEIVQGRHTVSGTINAFWSPGRNDRLQTRQDFLGREYIIMEVIAPGRVGAGTPVNVVEGAKMSRNGQAHGARGLKTIDLAYSAERRYTGLEWSQIAQL